MTNNEIIMNFFKACDSRDCDKVMEFFAEDAVWINVPLDPANNGKAEIRRFLEWFYSVFQETIFQIDKQVEGANGIVMNERTDWLTANDQKIALPVMGVFTLEDGKITLWKDYFDKSVLGL